MKSKLPSQVSITETVRLLAATADSSMHRGSLHLERARAVGVREMLGLWSLSTPEGPLFRVAIIATHDGEILWEEVLRDEVEARAVWEHIADTFEEQGSKQFLKR